MVNHFKPTGRILEPCAGDGAFYDALPDGTEWCEISLGRDFFQHKGRYDWIVTNPPWSLIRPFLSHSMALADNVVFLCLVNAFFMKARLRDMRSACFGIAEIALVDTPPPPWPQTGFQLGAVHIKRGYVGPVAWGDLSK